VRLEQFHRFSSIGGRQHGKTQAVKEQHPQRPHQFFVLGEQHRAAGAGKPGDPNLRAFRA
jgi:hypothetical protein